MKQLITLSLGLGFFTAAALFVPHAHADETLPGDYDVTEANEAYFNASDRQLDVVAHPISNPCGMNANGRRKTRDSLTTRSTGYFPDNSAMEGGFIDRRGHRLYTLQQYLNGNAPYVALAMDPNAAAYGTEVRLPKLNAKYGRNIMFKVVDSGGAFRGRGTSRVDICVGSNHEALQPEINTTQTLIFCR